MFIGSTNTIPAGHVGFVLPLGDHQFLLTGPATAIATVASHMARNLLELGAVDADDIECLKGDVELAVGTGDGKNIVRGHYLAIIALRRVMNYNIQCGRIVSTAQAPSRGLALN